MPTAPAPRFRPAPPSGAHLPRLRAQVQALTLARLVRRAVDAFPTAARLTTGDPMRRAAGHVAALVTDACQRRARHERARLLEQAWNSLRDVEHALAHAVAEGLLSADRGAEITRHCRWTRSVSDALMRAPMK